MNLNDAINVAKHGEPFDGWHMQEAARVLADEVVRLTALRGQDDLFASGWTMEGDRCYGAALERCQMICPGETHDQLNLDVVSLSAIVSQLIRIMGEEAFNLPISAARSKEA